MMPSTIEADLHRVAKSFARVIQKHNLDLLSASLDLQQRAEIILRSDLALRGEGQELPWDFLLTTPPDPS